MRNFKQSTVKALRTAVQVLTGVAAAVPVLLTIEGLGGFATAGATVVAVATGLAKVMNTAADELD